MPREEIEFEALLAYFYLWATDRFGNRSFADAILFKYTGSTTGCLVSDDFQDGTVAPWAMIGGDVTVDAGRLRVVRTPSNWGEAEQILSTHVTGAWEMKATMALLTSQSLTSLCLRNTQGTTPESYCLTLGTKTENGSTKGAHFLYNTIHDNAGSQPDSKIISYAFDPGVGANHQLRLIRDASGGFELFVDGNSAGTASDVRVSQFDTVVLYGMQDTSSGHGGYFDNISICE